MAFIDPQVHEDLLCVNKKEFKSATFTKIYQKNLKSVSFRFALERTFGRFEKTPVCLLMWFWSIRSLKSTARGSIEGR